MTTPLERLTQLGCRLDELQQQIPTVARECRAQGESWAAIGRALGITKQAAHARFGERPRDVEQLPLSDPLFDPLFQTPQD